MILHIKDNKTQQSQYKILTIEPYHRAQNKIDLCLEGQSTQKQRPSSHGTESKYTRKKEDTMDSPKRWRHRRKPPAHYFHVCDVVNSLSSHVSEGRGEGQSRPSHDYQLNLYFSLLLLRYGHIHFYPS
jgi:hypothetical protein